MQRDKVTFVKRSWIKSVPVRTSSGKSLEDLTIAIGYCCGADDGGDKCLDFKIMSEIDPFLLYTLSIGTSDFETLKKQLQLRIPFSEFPSKTIELLEKCIQDSSSESIPRFCAVLEVNEFKAGDCFLKVVQVTDFTEVLHLCLCFREGNDDSIKQHLASRLNETKALCSELGNEFSDCKEQVEDLRAINEKLKLELDETRHKLEVSLDRHQAEMEGKMAESSKNSLNALESVRSACEERLKNASQQEETRRKELSTRVRELEVQNSELTEVKLQLQSQVRELTNQLTSTSSELQHIRTELKTLRDRALSLETTNQELEVNISRKDIRVISLEQQVKDRDALLKTTQELLEASNGAKSSLESNMAVVKNNNTRLQEKLRFGIDEINKGNDIIRKLQLDLRGAKAKLKRRGEALKSQEAVLLAKDRELEKSARLCLEKDHGLQMGAIAQKQLAEENSTLKKQLENCKRTIETSQELIGILGSSKADSAEDSAFSFSPEYAEQFKAGMS